MGQKLERAGTWIRFSSKMHREQKMRSTSDVTSKFCKLYLDFIIRFACSIGKTIKGL